MIGHFSTDDLASYGAGMVSGGKAARISAHLSSCPECAGVQSGLADVSQLLASVRVPPMSEALTLRLQAVITDEAAKRAALVPGRSELAERTGRPVRRRSMRVWSSSPLLLRSLAAAGVVVLLVGGGVLLANQRGAVPSSARSSGQGAAPTVPRSKSRESTANVGSASTVTLRYRHAGGFVYANAVASDVDYTKSDLAVGIRHEMANVAQLVGPSASMPAASAAAEPRHALNHITVGRLESCLSMVATDHVVLLVEVARYLGLPATIIVLRPVGDTFEVIVVGEACGPAGQDILATVTVPTK